VIEAATIDPLEIDAMIVASSWPEHILPGDAVFLAEALGLDCPAWNVESTCTSALVALESAYALIRSGIYRNVLIVAATAYSRFTHEKDPLSYIFGDGGGAFIVGRTEPGRGVLGTAMSNTRETLGTVFNEFTVEPTGRLRSYVRGGRNPDEMFNETLSRHLLKCCHGALKAANVTLEQVRFFCFTSPTPWYARACARALGIDPARTLNITPLYAHIGMVFPMANLYHAAHAGKIAPDDLVLVYSFAFSSTAAAVVMRWGDVALGPPPALPLDASLRDGDRARLDINLNL
jgi:3-oxoacyl-[acyl-carrier-protein] synthase-3